MSKTISKLWQQAGGRARGAWPVQEIADPQAFAALILEEVQASLKLAYDRAEPGKRDGLLQANLLIAEKFELDV